MWFAAVMPRTMKSPICFMPTFARTKSKRRMGKYTYKPQYGVIVVCNDEAEQRAVFERLSAEGLTLKIVCV